MKNFTISIMVIGFLCGSINIKGFSFPLLRRYINSRQAIVAKKKAERDEYEKRTLRLKELRGSFKKLMDRFNEQDDLSIMEKTWGASLVSSLPPKLSLESLEELDDLHMAQVTWGASLLSSESPL